MDRLDLRSAPFTPDTVLPGPSTALTNNIYAAVIKVFKTEELQPNELYCLNENTRWLLRTDMGFFIKEYFQNQILTKGLSIILDEIQKHEGERQLFVLAQVWDRFFTEILPTLQAILCPLQTNTEFPVLYILALPSLLMRMDSGHYSAASELKLTNTASKGQELTVRQMALLGFRDLVLLKLSLGDLLCKNRSLIPASITQMLLVLGFRNPEVPQSNIANLRVFWR
ncbi:proline-rich protein 5-like isoform X3 [Puntigrus tetrazona]|uniref:proline-rich protein 5-like isoform X3 n=1 Tax=Puntigrus tetrazona TaxID=1606681 RepID=UPI001C8AC521|nr:proline-rich protein 5-like isoform X3 [Puntigrus tetrazona]